MMVGVVQNKLIHQLNVSHNNISNETKSSFDFEITPVVVTTSLTFFVGVFQVSILTKKNYNISHKNNG